MKIAKKISHLSARYPFVVVMLVAASVIGVVAIGKMRKPEIVDAQIIFEEEGARPLPIASRARPRAFYDVTQDPNYLTADRLRDASSVALLLALRRVNVFVQKQPAPQSVDALVSGVLPELEANGVTGSPDGSPGVLLGPGSTLYIRYRISPFAVEVVSIPASNRNGDNIIVRLPAEETAQPGNAGTRGAQSKQVSIFTHPYAREIELPAPFSSLELIEAEGWKLEELRQSSMTPEQVSGIVNSLRQVR